MIEQRHLPEGIIPATGGDGAAPDNSLTPPFPSGKPDHGSIVQRQPGRGKGSNSPKTLL